MVKQKVIVKKNKVKLLKNSAPREAKRRGRKPSRSLLEFPRLGGHFVLDFANTVIHHVKDSKDYLRDAERLGRWFELFLEQPKVGKKVPFSERDLNLSLELRKNLRNLLSGIIENNKISLIESLKRINQQFSGVQAQPSLELDQHLHLKMRWIVENSSLSSDVAVLMSEIGQFLHTADPNRIKQCQNPNCSHYFYDVSKNRSRNWCSMKSCGNIIKARKFYKKAKAEKLV